MAKALASFRRQDQKSESMDEAQWSLLLDKIWEACSTANSRFSQWKFEAKISELAE